MKVSPETGFKGEVRKSATDAELIGRVEVICVHCFRDFTMAEINKLSVGQAIDKLRGKDAPKSKMDQLDQKIYELDDEARRLRAERHRIERDQRANQNPASLNRSVDEPARPHGFFQNKTNRLIFFVAAIVVLLVLVLSIV